jgi:hypothetical protein
MEKWGGAEVLRRAVRGMLPKNRLRDVRLRRLRGKVSPVCWCLSLGKLDANERDSV